MFLPALFRRRYAQLWPEFIVESPINMKGLPQLQRTRLDSSQDPAGEAWLSGWPVAG